MINVTVADGYKPAACGGAKVRKKVQNFIRGTCDSRMFSIIVQNHASPWAIRKIVTFEPAGAVSAIPLEPGPVPEQSLFECGIGQELDLPR